MTATSAVITAAREYETAVRLLLERTARYRRDPWLDAAWRKTQQARNRWTAVTR